MDSKRLRFVIACALLLGAVACGGNNPKEAPGALPGDQALFDDGTAAMKDEDWEKGRTLLQQLVDAYPQSSLAPKARIAIADSYFRQNDETNRAQATVEYQAFISLYPFSESAAYAQFQLGMLKFRQVRIASRDQTETRDALRLFEKVVSEYPGSEYVEQARQKIAECRDRLAEHELVVALFYFKTKSYDAALPRLQRIVADFPDFSRLDEVYYNIGDALARTGKNDEAIPYFRKVAESKPTGPLAAKANERIRELGEPR